MARKNKDGRFILSAGEIGIFTVCPEAWRLRVVENKKREMSESVAKGSDLHQEWAVQHEEAAFFHRGMRVMLFLISMAILGTLIFFE